MSLIVPIVLFVGLIAWLIRPSPSKDSEFIDFENEMNRKALLKNDKESQ